MINVISTTNQSAPLHSFSVTPASPDKNNNPIPGLKQEDSIVCYCVICFVPMFVPIMGAAPRGTIAGHRVAFCTS